MFDQIACHRFPYPVLSCGTCRDERPQLASPMWTGFGQRLVLNFIFRWPPGVTGQRFGSKQKELCVEILKKWIQRYLGAPGPE
eukprot:s80_g23.t1